MHKLSKTSLDRLYTCHPDLIKIVLYAISVSRVDLGVAEGHRTLEDQKKYYDEGKSRIDGINKKGKHNYFPSLAVDIYAFYNGKAQWDRPSLCYLAGVMVTSAQILLKQKEISHELRWGGNWNTDSTIIRGQNLIDLPHFELIAV